MTELVTTINSVHAFNDSQQAVDAKQLTAQLQDSDDTVYLFYSHPSVYVAEQLKQGHNGNTACTDWLNGINTALTVQRKHRRRLRLLCLQDALVHGNELTRQTGLSTDVLTDYDVNPDGLELMAGHQLVLQNDDIMQLIERLEASTLQLSEQAYHVAVDVEVVLANAVGVNTIGDEVETLKNENDVLDAQLEKLQELVAEESTKNATKIKELAAQKEKIEELQKWCKIHEERERELKQQVERKDELIQKEEINNGSIKQENEALQTKITDLQRQNEEQRQELKSKEEKLQQLTQKKEKILTLEKAVSDSEEEIELILAQLRASQDSIQSLEKERLEKNVKISDLSKWCKVHEEHERELKQQVERKDELIQKEEINNGSIKQENEALQTKITDLQRQNEEQRQELKSKEEKLQQLTQKKEKILTLEKAVSDSEEEIDLILAQLRASQDSIQSLEKERLEKSAKISELSKWCKVHEEREVEFKSQLEEKNKELEKLLHGNRELESENQALLELIEDSESNQSEDLQNTLLAVQETLEHELQTNAELTQTNAELTEKNEHLSLQLKQALEELKYKEKQQNTGQARDQQESRRLLEELFKTQEQLVTTHEALDEAKNYQKKFKEEQQKVNWLREGIVQLQSRLLEQQIKSSMQRPVNRREKLKQKIFRRKPSRRTIPAWLNEQIQQIEHSVYFDKEWYVSHYPDLQSIDISPAEHFVRYGGFENRKPGPNFDTEFYVKKYPDVLIEGMNPLLHYIIHGEAEGRLPKGK